MNTKAIVSLFLVFAWLAPLAAQYDSETADKDRMAKAKVKTQTQWTHEYVDGKPSAKGYKSSVTKYNARGNITEVTNFNKEGKIISLVVYQYDNRENRVNYEQYQGNREKQQFIQKTVYDARGNKTREYGYDGVSAFSNTFKYDGDGKLAEINYTVDNVSQEKRVFKHSGNKTEILIYNAANTLINKQENTYNDKGMLVSEVKSGGTGNVVHTLGLHYNSAGDLLEEMKTRAGDKLDYQKIYQYDRENRPIKIETVNIDGEKFVSNEYQFNERGDLVLESWKKNERAKEPSTKKITYDYSTGVYTEMDYYYSTYPLKSLYKYTYEFY